MGCAQHRGGGRTHLPCRIKPFFDRTGRVARRRTLDSETRRVAVQVHWARRQTGRSVPGRLHHMSNEQDNNTSDDAATGRRIKEAIGTLDPTDTSIGYEIVRAAMTRFGFAGVIMGPGDAEEVWAEMDEEDGAEIPFDFDKVASLGRWRKGFENEAIMEDAWEIVREAVREARGRARSEMGR